MTIISINYETDKQDIILGKKILLKLILHPAKEHPAAKVIGYEYIDLIIFISNGSCLNFFSTFGE